MSTANGHGLVDPKIWGKPVGFANKVGRVSLSKRVSLKRQKQGASRPLFFSLKRPFSEKKKERTKDQKKEKGAERPFSPLFFSWTYAQHRTERESGPYSGTRRVDKRVTAPFSCLRAPRPLFPPLGARGWGARRREEGEERGLYLAVTQTTSRMTVGALERDLFSL